MEVEIKSDRKNVLLNRREVRFRLSFQGATPTRKDVRSKLVAVLSSSKELTVLDRLDMNFGSQTAEGYVKVYNDKNAMKIETDHIMKRNFPPAKADGEADKAAEKPAEGQ
jgi:small subunit ribosomal protein S24e